MGALAALLTGALLASTMPRGGDVLVVAAPRFDGHIASTQNAMLELSSMLVTVQHYLLRSLLIVLGAIVVARTLTWLISHTTLSPRGVRLRNLSEQRATTLRLLVSSLLQWLAGSVAILVILGMFVPISALLTALGLFSAAISLSAMNYVKDFFGGVVLLFEDEFAVGDKVQLGDHQVSGVVERVTLRTTTIRGEAGDLWIVPNGEVRTIRNFTRGAFSPASLRLTVLTHKLDAALALLEAVRVDPGPDVIEPPEIISEEGELGSKTTTITLKVKARYGCAPAVRRRLLPRLQADLTAGQLIEV